MSDAIPPLRADMNERLQLAAIEATHPETGVSLSFVSLSVAQAVVAQAIHRLTSESGWQPIESAPKDGTLVLMFEPCGNNNRVVGRWVGMSWVSQPGGYSSRPTHWMPLPTPPKTP